MQHPPQHSLLTSQKAPSAEPEHSQVSRQSLAPQHVVPAAQMETATHPPFAHMPVRHCPGSFRPEQSTGVETQPPAFGSQTLFVQGLPSSHSTGM